MTQKSHVRMFVIAALAGASLILSLVAAAPVDRPLTVSTALQSESPTPDMGAPEVSLARLKAVRGETVYIPLVVFQDDLKVTRTSSEIRFPTKTVAFEGFDRIPDQDPALKIDAALVPNSKDSETGVVRVDIASGRNLPLPEGALLKLKFKLSDTMPAGILDLKHFAKAVTVDGKTVTALSRDASLDIAEVQVYTCFFYMH